MAQVQNAAQPNSGQSLFQPSLGDLTLEAFDRIQVRPTSLTADHMRAVRMSSNLLLSEWSVADGNGLNLWKQQLISIPLTQGVETYAVPPNVVSLLDYYIRYPVTVANATLTNPFTTTKGSPYYTVAQTNHGLNQASYINILSPVLVDGVWLFGVYEVQEVLTANAYQIVVNGTAAQGLSAVGGSVNIRTELAPSGYADLPVIPFSRTDYAYQPDKQQQGLPTNVMFLRRQYPQVYFWLTPDGNGPYCVYAWAVMQPQDALLPNGAVVDIPYRFQEAFAAALAAKLAWKFPPPINSGITIPMLEAKAKDAWTQAAEQDSELNVPLSISVGLNSYYR